MYNDKIKSVNADSASKIMIIFFRFLLSTSTPEKGNAIMAPRLIIAVFIAKYNGDPVSCKIKYEMANVYTAPPSETTIVLSKYMK